LFQASRSQTGYISDQNSHSSQHRIYPLTFVFTRRRQTLSSHHCALTSDIYNLSLHPIALLQPQVFPRKMAIDLSPQEEEAIKIISPEKFHRLFTLPATENHGLLKVSYAVAGPEGKDIPTILFCGGMFCTRWHIIQYEYLAHVAGVRIVSIDRSVSHPSLC
jgi:hypothetical protein